MRFLREALAVAGLLFQIGVVWTAWQDLPAQVPTHYGFNGQADGFGGRNAVLALPAVALGLYVLLTVVSRFPQRFNYPVPVTEENRGRLQAIAVGTVGWLKAELTCGFAYIGWAIVQQARGLSNGLGWAFLPIYLGLILATLAIEVTRIRRAA